MTLRPTDSGRAVTPGAADWPVGIVDAAATDASSAAGARATSPSTSPQRCGSGDRPAGDPMSPGPATLPPGLLRRERWAQTWAAAGRALEQPGAAPTAVHDPDPSMAGCATGSAAVSEPGAARTTMPSIPIPIPIPIPIASPLAPAAAVARPPVSAEGATRLPLATWRARHDVPLDPLHQPPHDPLHDPSHDALREARPRRSGGESPEAGELPTAVAGDRITGLASAAAARPSPGEPAAGRAEGDGDARAQVQALVRACCERLWIAEPGGATQGVLLDLGRWMPGCTLEIAKAQGRLQLRLRGVDDGRIPSLSHGLEALGEGVAERLGCRVVTSVEGRSA